MMGLKKDAARGVRLSVYVRPHVTTSNSSSFKYADKHRDQTLLDPFQQHPRSAEGKGAPPLEATPRYSVRRGPM